MRTRPGEATARRLSKGCIASLAFPALATAPYSMALMVHQQGDGCGGARTWRRSNSWAVSGVFRSGILGGGGAEGSEGEPTTWRRVLSSFFHIVCTARTPGGPGAGLKLRVE